MRKIINYAMTLMLLLVSCVSWSQEDYQKEIEELNRQREQIEVQERDALKREVESINERRDLGQITAEEAVILKENAAVKRAKNIEDRLAIIDSRIALLERNRGELLEGETEGELREEEKITIIEKDDSWDAFDKDYQYHKYDRRTYSNGIIAFGLNNAIPEGGTLNDSPYSAWRSRFFEIGWAWRTRVFNNTNFMRFHYGFSFTFNGLRNSDNLYFTQDDEGRVVREVFPEDLDKSKLRTDNLIFPLHFEFGPSKKTITDTNIRYSISRQFRLGIGGYTGINLGTRQKLKYSSNGENIKVKNKGGFNPNEFIYGVSGWIGVGSVQFNVRYDLQTILKDSDIQENNISFGLRFEI